MSRDHIDRVCGELWFIFGEHTDGSGCVDVSDGQDDVFAHIPRAKAERLIKLRADFLTAVRAEYESTEPARACPARAGYFHHPDCAKPGMHEGNCIDKQPVTHYDPADDGRHGDPTGAMDLVHAAALARLAAPPGTLREAEAFGPRVAALVDLHCHGCTDDMCPGCCDCTD